MTEREFELAVLRRLLKELQRPGCAIRNAKARAEAVERLIGEVQEEGCGNAIRRR